MQTIEIGHSSKTTSCALDLGVVEVQITLVACPRFEPTCLLFQQRYYAFELTVCDFAHPMQAYYVDGFRHVALMHRLAAKALQYRHSTACATCSQSDIFPQ